MSKVIFGFLGTQLDGGFTEKRWDRWRPSVGLAGWEETVNRIELFTCKEADAALATQVTADVAQMAPHIDVRVHNLNITDPWNFAEVYGALHDFARAYHFKESDEYLVHLTTGTHVAQICLFLLTEARYIPGKLLGTRSAGNKGVETAWRGLAEVIDLNLASYDNLASRFRQERTDSIELLKGGIVTRNEPFNALISRIETVSIKSTAPVLLTGPTGAGKSQLAGRIYALRHQKHLATGEFVEVNCATLRGENAMSALFGHKKGAFTGAVSDRPGLLRRADKGILFLDEIGELGLDEQAMLLRALEDKRFLPLGADKESSSDFQLLAGTNRDLRAAVRAGTFRGDLLARIDMWTFTLPGLAERKEDIEPNLDYELECAGRELGGLVSMNKEAREAFLAYAHKAPWTGNFRDFKASVMRMATLCQGGRIRKEDVVLEVGGLVERDGAGEGDVPASANLVRKLLGEDYGIDPFDAVQLEYVLKVIVQSNSLADAGRTMFAHTRSMKSSSNDSDRLKKYLARFGVDFSSAKQALAN